MVAIIDMLPFIIWIVAGVGVGILLAWWQSRTIKQLDGSPPEKMMGRVYLHSLPRILLVSALLFTAMTQGIWFGICFAVGFTVSRWIWAGITLSKLKRKNK